MATERPIYRRVDWDTVNRLLQAHGYRILGDLSPTRAMQAITRARQSGYRSTPRRRTQ